MTIEEAKARWICCPLCDKKKCERNADDCDVNIHLKNKAEGGKRGSMNCEDCEYTDIADWEQDKTTGKARPVYWCERYKKMCSSISECQYKAEEEVEE